MNKWEVERVASLCGACGLYDYQIVYADDSGVGFIVTCADCANELRLSEPEYQRFLTLYHIYP